MSKTIKVVKTDRLDQKKLRRVARRYHLAPIVIRELQLGYTEELEEHVALKMIEAGLVQKAKKKKDGDPRNMQEKVASRIVLADATATVDDPDDAVIADDKPVSTWSEIDGGEIDELDIDKPDDDKVDRSEENFIE